MKIVALLKVKFLAIAVAGVVLAGGAAAVVAATPAGQQLFHATSHSAQVTKTTDANQQNQKDQTNTCPGLADAQNLATHYSLSSASQSTAVQAICALHIGTFKGTTPGNKSVSSSRVYGYGEIDQLLTYASYLATHDKTNSVSKLTDENVQSYLAEALQSCGASPLDPCLKTNIPNYQPGNGGNNGNGGGNGNGNGNGGSKPTGTPTPHA